MNTGKKSYNPKTISTKQELFLRYFTFTLIDLVVLSFFAEYLDKVTITSFGITFIIVVVTILLAEYLIARLYRSLA